MSGVKWERRVSGSGFYAKVEVEGYDPRFQGYYEIEIARRPSYCDRGDWIIYVYGYNNDVDGADGFPRYYFGSEGDVMAQMETWLNRRRAYNKKG